MTAISPRMRRRLVNRGLDALICLMLVVMLAPVFWLVLSSLQSNGRLTSGTFDLLHPTFTAFGQMWNRIDFGHYFLNSAVIFVYAFLFAWDELLVGSLTQVRAETIPLGIRSSSATTHRSTRSGGRRVHDPGDGRLLRHAALARARVEGRSVKG